MKWWFGILGLLAVVGVLGPIVVAVSSKGPVSETGDLLVVGQTYVFTGDPTIIGEVLEKPRGNWVQVRIVNKSKIPAKITWVNLKQVKAVSLVDPQDVKDEPRP